MKSVVLFVLFIVINGDETKQSCGDGCFYQVSETNLMIEVHGDITKEEWENKETISEIEINGIINSYPNDFIKQFISLERITIDVPLIPDQLFEGSTVREVVIGKNVEEIGFGVFENCQRLFSILFSQHSGLKTINDYAFRNCIVLSSIELPSRLTTIEFYNVFQGCRKLQSITFESNEKYEVIDGMILSNNKQTLEYVTPNTIQIEHIIVPLKVEEIEEKSIERKTTSIVTLPTQLTRINDGAMQHNQIEIIVIPENVEYIGRHAFEMNRKMRTVIIKSKNVVIDENAFYGCDTLQTIVFDGETMRTTNAFEGCEQLTQIQVKQRETISLNEQKTITEIQKTTTDGYCGDSCYYLIEETKMRIYGSGPVEQIIDFNQKETINEIVIEEGITRIEQDAFDGFTSLETITMPSSLRSIAS